MTVRSRKAQVLVGCAGWAIPAAHRGLFAPGDSVLARYASRFGLVEINSSFYRPHRRETYARWAASTPAGFRFAVKLPRTITHDARLRGAGSLLDAFLHACGGLGSKLDVLLVQLPPSLACEPRQAAAFFAALRRRWQHAVACEPRHASWFTPAADALLRRHRIARVAADPAPHPDAALPGGDPAHAYWRWHGAPRMYYDAYSPDWLRAQANAIAERSRRGQRTWVVFDNTAAGHAIGDADQFRALVA